VVLNLCLLETWKTLKLFGDLDSSKIDFEEPERVSVTQKLETLVEDQDMTTITWDRIEASFHLPKFPKDTSMFFFVFFGEDGTKPSLQKSLRLKLILNLVTILNCGLKIYADQPRSGFEFEKIQARPVTILKDTPTITWQDDFIRLSSSSEKKQTRTSYSYSFDFVLVYNNDRTYSFNCKIFL